MQIKEYVKSTDTVNIQKCIEAHKQIFENWPYGRVIDSWTDENGNIYIQYMSGKCFRYKISDTGKVQWW